MAFFISSTVAGLRRFFTPKVPANCANVEDFALSMQGISKHSLIPSIRKDRQTASEFARGETRRMGTLFLLSILRQTPAWRGACYVAL
jgi:hypothetical protein